MTNVGLLRTLVSRRKNDAAESAAQGLSYLFRDLEIDRANPVWCTDITYIPMRKGSLYLVTIMDWHSRKVLSWRLSNSLDTAPCFEALEEALAIS